MIGGALTGNFGLANAGWRSFGTGVLDLLGAALPKYAAWTGLAWPGSGHPAISWLVANNNLDYVASRWHDMQKNVFLRSAPQFGWIKRAWTGGDAKFSARDVLALGPYGQAVRAFGTVLFATGGVLQRGLGL